MKSANTDSPSAYNASRRIFSYDIGVNGRMRRRLIRLVETGTGSRKLARMYDGRRPYLERGVGVWTAATELMRLNLRLIGESLTSLPRQGPLVVLSNHPFGVVDGIVLCHLLSQVRTDFKILIHHGLEHVPDIQQYLLPIDFSGHPQAIATNLRSRAQALQVLKQGGAVIVFPSGGVSTSPRVFGKAVDDTWKPFTARMIRTSNATVVPMFVDGQNSRLFQLASHLSMTLRLALLTREACRKIGKTVTVAVGRPLEPAALEAFRTRDALIEHLRAQTYSLAALTARPALRPRGGIIRLR